MKKMISVFCVIIIGLFLLMGCEQQITEPVAGGRSLNDLTLMKKDNMQKSTSRSLGELLNAQGKTVIPAPHLPDGLWYYPYPNTIGWADPLQDRLAMVDYTGLLNQWLMDNGHPGYGTEITGTVKEKALADGRAEIKVILHVQNAITWVTGDWASSWKYGPQLFGDTPLNVLDGAAYALCDCKFSTTFITTHPGAPLPDIFQIYFFPGTSQKLKKISLVANGSGPLGDGSPGRMHITELRLSDLGNQEPGESKWPVEMINIWPVGK